MRFNPLNADLNPICHLLALLAAHHILHVSRITVNFIAQIIFQDQGKPRQLCLIQLPSPVKKNKSKILPQTLPEKSPGGFTST
jgi:hypothetical protein